MARSEKRLAKMEPSTTLRLAGGPGRVIESFGFQKDRQSGSHVIYRHPTTGSKIAFAHRRPTLDAAYVKEAIRVLRSMEGE